MRYEAKAIGSGSEGAQTSLQENYRKDMTLKEAETLALSTLKAVMEEKVGAGSESQCGGVCGECDVASLRTARIDLSWWAKS